jgi:hypothetical protein
LPGCLLAAVLPVPVLPVPVLPAPVLRGAVLLARASLARAVGGLPGRGAMGLPPPETGRLVESGLACRPLPGRVRSVPEARRALVRVRLPGTRLKEVLLSGTGLSGTGLPGTGLPEPGLPDALLSRWPRLTLARSWCLAPACPAGTVLSRLVLTLTGHAALSGT